MINYFSLCMSKYMFVGSSCWKIFSLDMEFEGDRFFSLHILKFFFTLFFVLFLIWNLLSFSIWYVPPPAAFQIFFQSLVLGNSTMMCLDIVYLFIFLCSEFIQLLGFCENISFEKFWKNLPNTSSNIFFCLTFSFCGDANYMSLQ